jgi:hypothetical protein
MNFTGWKYYKDPITNENIGIMLIEGDVCQSRLLTDLEVAQWLSEENIPLPAST